jgi:hypothetical protein
MGGIFMKSREVKQTLGITRRKLGLMVEAGALKRVHFAFKRKGDKLIPADHGWFRRTDIEALAGGE